MDCSKASSPGIVLSALVALGASYTAPARASERVRGEPARVTLDWSAPPDCAEDGAVLARVEQLLGERGNRPSGVSLDVREVVTLLPDGRYHVEISAVHAGVEHLRTLDAATCSEVVEASAVVIALAISPETGDLPATELPATAVTDSTARSPGTEPGVPREPASASPPQSHPSNPRSSVRVAAGLAVDFGAIAPVAPGLSAAGAFRFAGIVELGVRSSFFPARTSALSDQPNKGADSWLLDFAPFACVGPPALPVELGACAVVAAGYLRAEGFGTRTYYERSLWWLAPGAGLTAAYPANGRIRSRLSVDALFPVAHTEFVLTNAGVVRKLPVVAPRAALYVELAFP
ncbi:MAG TPA: hypothetical protein VGK73_03185 [Polyangiaceae bacterium]